ncbi:MAG: response regulator, partial [Candidatus Lindowbacteria bacterium]|nr:response regulator [Candidatus Lindowbacteria bacterium]
ARATIINENDEIGVLSRIFNTMVETVAERERIDKERLAEIRNMNEELQHASKMKSHFLATMSHELRTPMNSIIGYSDLLLDGIDGELNPDQTEDVQSVLRSAEHLLTLINDVLDLSKIEAGHMKVDLSEIRIQDAVQEVMDQVSPILKEKKLLSEVKYIDENVVVLADYDRLRQILLNLISNALKFTDTGSITVRVMKDDEFGIFSVEDTGVGVPEEYLKSIFEEFQQVDGATTRKHGGTGLGLTIVRRLVELMDGTVSVSSQLGSGSIFHVKLPLAHPREMRDSVKEKPMTGILLVDDDPETIALFGRYLAKERIGIIAARSVAEAKRILEEALEEKNEKTEIAAVLLDLHLPDASGYDLLKFMKQSEDWKNTPVAIVTIADDNGTSVKNGASTHMVKPINRAELLKMVNTLLAESERIKAND